jgi:hypothetical protein
LVDNIVSFFVIKSGCKLLFERKEQGLSEVTTYIIHLIGPAGLQATKLTGYTSYILISFQCKFVKNVDMRSLKKDV